MTKIILNGCLGRMGRVVRELTENDPEAQIVAGLDIAHAGAGLTFPFYTALSYCDMPADVVIDFSDPNAMRDLLEFCVEKQIPAVIGTTGLLKGDINEIDAASERVAIFKSANLSLGINLLSHIVEKAAKLLYDANFDIEIVEKHHNKKLDAPSGTALFIADTINKALGGKMKYVTDRSRKKEKRNRNELGLHALRGGTIVGEHSVVFAGRDEVVEINHSVLSREVFAVGSLKAAEFIKNKPPGLYDMRDLINSL